MATADLAPSRLTAVNEAVSAYLDRYAKTRLGKYLLLFPVFLVMVVLLVVPTLLLLQMSLHPFQNGTIVREAYTFSNYASVLTDTYYRTVIGRTLKIAVIVTFVDFCLGFPLAYAAVRGGRLLGGAIVVVTLAPLSIDLIIRTYGWYVLLGSGGFVPTLLVDLGVGTAENPPKLLFNEAGIIIGLIHVLLPFMVFPIMNVLHTIPRSYEEAARNLGANRLVVFWKVLFPLAIPGIAAGTLLVFTITIAAYVTPAILGGGVKTLAVVITETFDTTGNWPLGGTLAVLLVAISLVVIGLYQRVLTQLGGVGGSGN